MAVTPMHLSLLLLLSAVGDAHPAVVLDVPVDAPCALARELPVALTEEHVAVAPSRWRLEARVGPQTLDVSLFDPQSVLRGARTFQPSEDDCPLIPKAIATLVRTWLASALEVAPVRAPSSPLQAPATPGPSRPATRVLPTQPESTPELVEEASLPELPLAEVVVAPPPPLPVAQLDDEDLEVQAAREAIAPRPPIDEPEHAFSIQAFGGGALAPGDAAVLHASIGADWAFSVPFALQIDGGIETTRSGAWSLGVINASLSWLGLALRCRALSAGLSGLFISLGGRFERIAVSVEGEETDGRNVVTGAAFAAVEWRQALRGALFFAVKTYAQLRPRAEDFSVREKAEVLAIPPWGFGASVGLGWSFF
jgi:hypothetical protein